MATNGFLTQARKAKNDEFYTLYSDIEAELTHYESHLRNKVIYCNCDNPYNSNFVKYFYNNFERLHLKGLKATCWSGEPSCMYQKSLLDESEVFQSALYLNIEEGSFGKPLASYITELKGNGDFRSSECKSIMEASDIIITNPPFSLFLDEFNQLFFFKKQFLILGNMNGITYGDVFPHIMDGTVWIGYKPVGIEMLFDVPEEYRVTLVKEKTEGGGWRRKKGKVYGRVASACWFTNIGNAPVHEKLTLTEIYDPKKYPNYDNYNAIEVSNIADIPKDYKGLMGVPITFLGKYNPDQFEIIGQANHGNTALDLFKPMINGKLSFKKLIIKNKHPEVQPN